MQIVNAFSRRVLESVSYGWDFQQIFEQDRRPVLPGVPVWGCHRAEIVYSLSAHVRNSGCTRDTRAWIQSEIVTVLKLYRNTVCNINEYTPWENRHISSVSSDNDNCCSDNDKAGTVLFSIYFLLQLNILMRQFRNDINYTNGEISVVHKWVHPSWISVLDQLWFNIWYVHRHCLLQK